MIPYDRAVFFDLETGGLDHNAHPIIQIAAIAVDSELNEFESFEVKINFDRNAAEKEALEKNNYDPDVWEREQVPFVTAITRFDRFLQGYRSVRKTSMRTGRDYWVAKLGGHNVATFDMLFLQKAYKIMGDRFLAADFLPLDTLQLASWDCPETENLKLGTLYRHFTGTELEGAHDALADVRATIIVAKGLLNWKNRERETSNEW